MTFFLHFFAKKREMVSDSSIFRPYTYLYYSKWCHFY